MAITNRVDSIRQVTSSKSWGGRESVPVGLHHKLILRAIDTRLYCAESSAIARRYGEQSGITVLPFRGVLDGKTRRALVHDLKDDLPVVVLCHFSHDLPLIRMALRRVKSARLVLIKHVGPGKPKKDLLHRWVYRRVDKIFGVSEYIARRCRETYPIAGDRVLVWHPGVDHNRICFQAEERSRIRGELGLDASDILIGYIARLTPGKGHRNLMRAFLSLAAERENVYLVLPGSATAKEQSFADALFASANASPAGKRVIRPGFVENVAGWLSACDIFANPSPKEAFGLNTIEAMATGRPVVGTTGGGTPEIISHEESGFLVEPDKPDELAATLLRLIANDDLRRRIGRAARVTVEDRFTLDRALDRLLELIL